MPKKSNKIENPVMRKCDCWLEIGTCFCDLNLEERQATRYSVLDLQGEVHSRWETINEALQDGRKRLNGKFNIFDNLEKRTVINYE
jgi:hypothetical protein